MNDELDIHDTPLIDELNKVLEYVVSHNYFRIESLYNDTMLYYTNKLKKLQAYKQGENKIIIDLTHGYDYTFIGRTLRDITIAFIYYGIEREIYIMREHNNDITFEIYDIFDEYNYKPKYISYPGYQIQWIMAMLISYYHYEEITGFERMLNKIPDEFFIKSLKQQTISYGFENEFQAVLLRRLSKLKDDETLCL